MKVCLVYRVTGELGSILSVAASKVNHRLGGGVIIPTDRGIPFHLTLRSPVKGLLKKQVRQVCDTLQDMRGTEARITGWSSFVLSGAVFARVVIDDTWSKELDQLLASTPMGPEKSRVPHITVVKGIESASEIDAAIDTLKYWVPALPGWCLPIDQLTLYVKDEGERIWTSFSKINLRDVQHALC